MPENPVNGKVARAELGKPGPPMGATRFSALKRAMGINSHYVLVSKMRAWLHEHPEFTERSVYVRRSAPKFSCPACRKEVSKYEGTELLRWHKNQRGEVCHGV